MKMILKGFYLSLVVISVFGLLQLAGCVVPWGEQAFGYRLYIENSSGREVVSCYDVVGSSCVIRLKDGEVDVQYFILRGEVGTAEEMSVMIDDGLLIICGVTVKIKDVLLVSPLEKYGEVDYKLVINDRVNDLFCH